MIVDQKTITKQWYRMYHLAEEYFNKYGDLAIPKDYIAPNSGDKLGKWIITQRSAKRAGEKRQTITQQQIQMLDKIGMVWGKEDTGYHYSWDDFLAQLKKYKRKHGDCLVKESYKTRDGYALGKKVADVRSNNKDENRRKKIPDDVRKKLDDLGFVWDLQIDAQREDSWLRGYNCLKDYFMSGGHQEDITSEFVWNGYPLGKWIYRQTSAYNQVKSYESGLLKNRYDKLIAIGFSFAVMKPRTYIQVHDLGIPSVVMPESNKPVLLKYTIRKRIVYREAVWENETWYVAGKKIPAKRALAWAKIPNF